MEFNFSLAENQFTPIRPQKVDRLFYSTPERARNDITYQVPLTQCEAKSDFTYQIPATPLSQTCGDKYPRHSTGLVKRDKIPIEGEILGAFMDETSVDSNIMMETTNHMPNDETTNLMPKDETINHMLKDETIPPYQPIYQILDSQPTRATCFHPTGDVFVVGSNTKTLRICIYPNKEKIDSITSETSIQEPEIAFKFMRPHRGSIYCAAFNNEGNLLATGSNDQTVRIIRYDSDKRLPKGSEYMLTMQSGTIRDLCFLPDGSEKGSSLLATSGAGEYEIFVTDCKTMKPVRTLVGHESSVMSLSCLNNTTTLYSASLDGTIRCWDARSKVCCKVISTNRPGGDAISGTNKGTPAGVVRVEETGKLLVSGHTDGRCMLYDIRGDRVIQLLKAHEDEIRTLNFSPKCYYLLTASYDRKVKLMDLQGDLTKKLPCVEIAELDDKVVQTAWHPDDYNFVTTCADGSATLWAMPGFCLNAST